MIINNDPVDDNLYRSARAVFSQANTSHIPSIGPFNLILDTRVDTRGPVAGGHSGYTCENNDHNRDPGLHLHANDCVETQ